MIPRAPVGLLLSAALAALGCTRTTELADWDDTGGEDGGVDDVIEMDCSGCPAEGAEIANLRCALDLCDPDVVLNGDGVYEAITPYRSATMDATCTVDDTREAIARFDLADAGNDLEPKLNGSYTIMTTGHWDAPVHSTSCSPYTEEEYGTDALANDENKPADTMYDAVEWTLRLRAPEEAKSFSFDYVFLSTEYDETITSPGNDKFYAVLEANSTNGGEPTVISYTACRDDDSYFDFECTSEMAMEQPCTAGVKYCYIAINSALSECCWWPGGGDPCPDGVAQTSIAGTGYECGVEGLDSSENGSSTGWLHTVWRIDPSEEFTLKFHIHDTADSTKDSAVILDAFKFHRKFSSGGTVVIE